MSHVTTAKLRANLAAVAAAAEAWGVDAAQIQEHAQPVQMQGYAKGHTATLTIAASALASALQIPAWSDLGAQARADGGVDLHVDGDMFRRVGGRERVEQDVTVAHLIMEARRQNVELEATYTTKNGKRVASLRLADPGRSRSRQRTR